MKAKNNGVAALWQLQKSNIVGAPAIRMVRSTHESDGDSVEIVG